MSSNQPMKPSLTELQERLATDQELQKLVISRIETKALIVGKPKDSSDCNKVLNYACAAVMVTTSILHLIK